MNELLSKKLRVSKYTEIDRETTGKLTTIGNLPKGVTEEALQDIFSPYGIIVSMSLSTKEAIIEFDEVIDCFHAVQNVHGYRLDTNYLKVHPYM